MKKWRCRGLLAISLTITLAGIARAQVTPEMAAQFVDAGQRYDDFPQFYVQQIVIRDLLRSAPRAEPMKIVPQLASRWRISEAAAAKILEALVFDTTQSYEFLPEKRRDNRARTRELYSAALKAAPDSADVWTLAIAHADDEGECGSEMRDDFLSRPLGERAFVQQTDCRAWRPAYARKFPQSLAGRLLFLNYFDYRHSADPSLELAASRWALDLLEQRRLSDDATRLVRQSHLSLLARNGLGSEILAEARALGSKLPALFVTRVSKSVVVDDFDLLNYMTPDPTRNLARQAWMFALVDAGHVEEARAAYDPILDGDGVVKDVIFGNPRADLFARYLEDRDEGILWKLRPVALSERVAARFLDSNGLTDAARYLEQSACRQSAPERDRSDDATQFAALPADFHAHRARYERLLAESRRAANCPTVATGAISTRLPRYEETSLTAEQRALPKLPGFDTHPALPPGFGLVRAEKRGDEIRALCLSTAADPMGEVGPGGYWLLRSRGADRGWDTPLYLGFQERGPYVAKSDARLSMFADGMLRLEADVAELDPDSISFPPVMLSVRREVPDIVLDLRLSDLERDTDGDGWTDILEVKLHTDPTRADTDGDGLSDALDDFPQASARGTPDGDAEIIVDLLKRIMGFERAGIIEPVRARDDASLLSGLRRSGAGSHLFQIVVGDPAKFAGLRAESQVIILTEAQLWESRATSGPLYPLELPDILYDAKRGRAIVEWSAGWVGGTLLYRKVGGRWKAKEVSRWITRVMPGPRTSPG